MQEVKFFVCGHDRRKAEFVKIPIEEQINDYLKVHSDRTVNSISVVNGVGSQEAFVVFDIREREAVKKKQSAAS